MSPSVFCPVFFPCSRFNRPFFTIANLGKLGSINPKINEIWFYTPRSTVTQREIIRIGPPFITVSFNSVYFWMLFCYIDEAFHEWNHALLFTSFHLTIDFYATNRWKEPLKTKKPLGIRTQRLEHLVSSCQHRFLNMLIASRSSCQRTAK